MSARRLLRKLSPGPASRIAIGLVSLMVATLVLSDLFVGGFLPDRNREARNQRTLVVQLLVERVTGPLQQGGVGAMRAVLADTLAQTPDLQSVAIVSPLQEALVAGDHARHWTLAADAASTVDQFRLPIAQGEQAWGELQLAFRPVLASGWRGLLLHPAVVGIGLMVLLGFIGFQLYLRRTLRYLDPEAAVPERVRAAFDTLIEGVIVVEPSGLIMLANAAFRRLQLDSVGNPVGQPIERCQWLVDAFRRNGDPLPWHGVFAAQGASLAHRIRIPGGPEGRPRVVVLNCSPIDDGQGKVRGCLLTFSDITELEERTDRLQRALTALSASQAEIERKNVELTRLATRDALTGVLNRGTFMAEADRCFEAAQQWGERFVCVMCDIDHFKSVNDRFGHAAGDRVIKASATALGADLDEGDLLGRYGGEEFCLLLRGASLDRAMTVAEQIRSVVEASLGAEVPEQPGLRVTMSFGLAEYEAGTSGPGELIDRADQALYYSKQNGRNRVTSWPALVKARARQRMAAAKELPLV